MQNKWRSWNIELHYAKGYFLRCSVPCAKELFPPWKALDGNTSFFYMTFSWGQSTSGCFFFIFLWYAVHTGKKSQLPALLLPGEMTPDKKWNLSSLSAGKTKRPEQSHIPTAFINMPLSKCSEFWGQVTKPKPTLALIQGAEYETKCLF